MRKISISLCSPSPAYEKSGGNFSPSNEIFSVLNPWSTRQIDADRTQVGWDFYEWRHWRTALHLRLKCQFAARAEQDEAIFMRLNLMKPKRIKLLTGVLIIFLGAFLEYSIFTQELKNSIWLSQQTNKIYRFWHEENLKLLTQRSFKSSEKWVALK